MGTTGSQTVRLSPGDEAPHDLSGFPRTMRPPMVALRGTAPAASDRGIGPPDEKAICPHVFA